MTVHGSSKIDTLTAHEIHAVFGTTITLKAKVTFLEADTNVVHAQSVAEGPMWSPNTMNLLVQLQSAMETDLSKAHFKDGASGIVGEHNATGVKLGGGLGEHLTGEDAPSV